MKVKLTLILSQQDINLDFENDNYFKFFVTDDGSFPSKYISSKDEMETLKELFNQHFNIYFDWATINLADFRKFSTDTCEALYVCKIKTKMLGINKNGKFVSIRHAEKLQIEEFYGRILQREFRRF